MKKRSVHISSAASDDEAGILTHVLGARGGRAAATLDARLDRAERSLSQLADRGRIVPELRRHGIAVFRELQVPPYRIVYRIAGDEVWVIAVVDGRRDLEELLLERARRSIAP